ncbi:XRE family transcriptional regulator [Prauserella sp. PE36]|uniref:Helix-turn-helix domain-containing protein n=1 Tax=Prauserella endophytica TaxID=1592324 RepID=A0ABY2SCD5_9PSEU|nr:MULTISPECIES: helix-turn-helix transcriptional regulator [Prauserella]PXY35037.1 transcriptional regulator [Prauserella coralliicola]RBM19169.1 XRE family transcriptional regulator [Prauserella sp. PE36]TKG73567.1 helix-turn-helix domain-containing protein [Prauserella endophytica]
MADPGPVVPRRRIAEELRRLRGEAGRTLEEVAEALLISTSKLSRLENAQGRPQLRDIRDLVRFYGIEGTQVASRLERWTKASQSQGWWTDYSGQISDELGAHVAYETEASVARVYTIPAIPVLLQTADYARAYYRSTEPWRTSDDIEQLVELRMKRQRALRQREGQPPLTLVAVTHESSIRQLVGSPEIMRAQLDHLIESSTAPNIELRVFPFATQPLFTSTCMYAYFEFSEDIDRDVVHIETHAGIRHIERTKAVEKYREYHDALYRSSLTPEETRALIRTVRNEQFS